MNAITAAGPAERAGRREWLGLAVLALPALLVSIDVFVLLLALPTMTADLHASSTEQLRARDIAKLRHIQHLLATRTDHFD